MDQKHASASNWSIKEMNVDCQERKHSMLSKFGKIDPKIPFEVRRVTLLRYILAICEMSHKVRQKVVVKCISLKIL